MQHRRLFLALDLPEETRDQLMAVPEGLGSGREVPEENLHLTLAFLDSQPEQLLQPLHERLQQIRCPRIRLQLSGLELWGGRHPSTLVMRADPMPELTHLQQKVAQAVRLAGVELARRRFKPHVTLVRFRRGLPPEAQQRLSQFMAARGGASLPSVEAETFTLYQSMLHPEGPVYEPLARYQLDPV